LSSRILIKLSGKVISENNFNEMVSDIQQLREQGYSIALVHGGGKKITQYLNTLQIPSNFINGLRVTNQDAIQVVEMVLAGLINKELTRWLNRANLPAVGLSGSDDNLILARQLNPELGFVGEIEKINAELIKILWDAGKIVVIAPTGTSKKGECFNINADQSASALATALEVDHLIFLSDTEGVLDGGKKLDSLSVEKIAEFIQTGTASDGMIPKLNACKKAKTGGVTSIKIAPWAGVGTLLRLIEHTDMGTEILS
jgi:acetylglutamate kinase